MRQDATHQLSNLLASQWPRPYEIAATFRILRMVMEALFMLDPPHARGIKDEGNSLLLYQIRKRLIVSDKCGKNARTLG